VAIERALWDSIAGQDAAIKQVVDAVHDWAGRCELDSTSRANALHGAAHLHRCMAVGIAPAGRPCTDHAFATVTRLRHSCCVQMR
jgi:hypothetical protein